MDGPDRAGILWFEGFRFDCDGGRLYRLDGPGVAEPVALGSRARALLALLVERQGQLVAKDEIMETVWPGTAVEESNLSVQIAALRRVLDRDRQQESLIQTISGRGYRIAAPVTRVNPAALPASVPPSGDGAEGTVASDQQPEVRPSAPDHPVGLAVPITRGRHQPRRGIMAGVIAALVLIIAAVAAWHSPWFGEAPPAPRLSIVVLPFVNLGNDPSQQYFADGITEDLTTDLSRIADSFVISRNTAFTYRDKLVNTKQVGYELGVRYVLEGSVQRSANQVRINAQLIDAEADRHLWAERFDRDMSDLFSLQNEITGRIALALGSELVTAEAARPTANPDALDYILRGRAVRSKPPTRDNYAEAIGWFERALALDPRSVEAQSWLAIVLASRVNDQMSDSAGSAAADITRAEGLVGQALAISPSSPRAHFAKGDILCAKRQFAEAIPEYEMVLTSDPNSVGALSIIGRAKIYIGMIDEAIPLVEQALRLSPRGSSVGVWYSWIGQAHLLQSRTDEAILWFEKARSANPALPIVHLYLASAYALKGESERAAAELAEARRLNRDGRFSSIARWRAVGYFGVPKVRALYEATVFAGLRKAGMPEE
jgi:adenylate cyclase